MDKLLGSVIIFTKKKRINEEINTVPPIAGTGFMWSFLVEFGLSYIPNISAILFLLNIIKNEDIIDIAIPK